MRFRRSFIAFFCLILMSGFSALGQNALDTPVSSYILPGWYLECSGTPDKVVEEPQPRTAGGYVSSFWLQFSDKTIVVLTYEILGFPAGEKPQFGCGVAIVDGKSIKLSDGPVLDYHSNGDLGRLIGNVSLPTKIYSLDIPYDRMESTGGRLQGNKKYNLAFLQTVLEPKN